LFGNSTSRLSTEGQDLQEGKGQEWTISYKFIAREKTSKSERQAGHLNPYTVVGSRQNFGLRYLQLRKNISLRSNPTICKNQLSRTARTLQKQDMNQKAMRANNT
jgi:hypothetical protein